MDEYDQIRTLMYAQHHLDLTAYDRDYVESIILRRRNTTSCPDTAAYLGALRERESERAEFLASLHNTYTDFFRDPVTHALLEQHILPALLERKCREEKHALRIWSAACSTGQEAYGIAMQMEDLVDRRRCDCTYRVFATDRDAFVVEQAAEGRFEREDLRNLRVAQLDSYCSFDGAVYSIEEKIRKHIEFSVYDLFDADSICPPACIYADFDIVLCSNVLLYYSSDKRKLLLTKLRRCLAQHGILVTGEAEREIVSASGLFNGLTPGMPLFTINSERE